MFEVDISRQLNELKSQIEKVQRAVATLEEIKDSGDRTDAKTDKIIKCNERHKKHIIKHINFKVDGFMNTYEKGARKTLFGNIQGSIFSNYVVNAYEDLPYVVLPSVLSHIRDWIPNEELEEKLAKWKIDYEQLDMFEIE